MNFTANGTIPSCPGLRELNQIEAAEMLGVSERTFRRWCRRFEEEGETGRFDRRLGRPYRTAVAFIGVSVGRSEDLWCLSYACPDVLAFGTSVATI